MEKLNPELYIDLIKKSLEEDLNNFVDVTSDPIFSDSDKTEAVLVSKDSGILAGIDVFKEVFFYLDKSIEIKILKQEGEELAHGDYIAVITGNTKNILMAERTAINLLGFISGVATKAKAFADASNEGTAKILDTRKTLPGFRFLSKYAVKVAGCENHRMGLYDMVLIKDNHIDSCGSINKAVCKVRDKWGSKFKIEVEARDLKEVEEALQSNVDVIMLDNMDVQTMSQAVKLVNKKAKIEASGNMTIEKVKETSKIGVDYISVGSITHSVKTFDYSLRIGKKK